MSRSVTASRSDVIAVVLFSDDVLAKYSTDLSRTVRGVAAALAAAGKTMLYCDLSNDDEMPQAVRDGKIDGLLIAGGADARGRLADIPQRPMVWLTSHRDPNGSTAALAGNEHVGELAAEYLIGRGCRSLACLETHQGSPAITVRSKYFRFTAEQAGASCVQLQRDMPLPKESDPDGWNKLIASANELVDELVSRSTVPDGLLLSNPFVLGTVHAALRRHGIEPERDIKIVVSGYHEPLLAAAHPKPAAIDLRGDLIGRCAVQQLLNRIQDPSDTIAVDLIVRPRLVEPN